MAILSINPLLIGAVGNVPKIYQLQVTDPLSTILSVNYLHAANLQGYTISATDVLFISYANNAFDIFVTSVASNGDIILFLYTDSNPHIISTPGDVAVFTDTTGGIGDGGLVPGRLGSLTLSNGNLTISTGNATLTAGNLTISQGGETITNGTLALTNGNLTLGAGNIALTSGNITLGGTGGITLASGNITLTSGMVDFGTGSISLTSGNISLGSGSITLTSGNIILNTGNLTLTSGTLSVGSISTGSATITTGDLTISQGNEIITNGNLTLSQGNIALTNGGLSLNGTGNLTLASSNINLGSGAIIVGPTNISLTNGNVSLTSGNVALTSGNVALTSGYVAKSDTNNVTAFSGGGQSSATPLTTDFNNIATATLNGSSVLLPPAIVGRAITIANSNPLFKYIQVFGTGTDTINGVASNVGVRQIARSTVTYRCTLAGTWTTDTLGFGIFGSFPLLSSDFFVAFSGGGQGSATPLTSMINLITTAVNPLSSVILPSSLLGMTLQVINFAASNSINIYPQPGGQINTLGTNNPFTLNIDKVAIFTTVGSDQWFAIISA